MSVEKFEQLEKLTDGQLQEEMKNTKEKRNQIEKELYILEKQIYNLETTYLQDTYHIGNLVRGWTGYLTRSAPPHKKPKLKDSDRIFSLSSVDAIENIESEAKRERKRSCRKKYSPYKPGQRSSRARRSYKSEEED